MIIFTADLKNQPGELAHMCEALASAGINIELAGTAAGDHGLVSVVVSDEAAARTALNSANVSFTEHPALQIKLPDRPGEAARFARMLADAHVNLVSVLPISICGGEVTLALSADKPEDARRALGDLVVG